MTAGAVSTGNGVVLDTTQGPMRRARFRPAVVRYERRAENFLGDAPTRLVSDSTEVFR